MYIYIYEYIYEDICILRAYMYIHIHAIHTYVCIYTCINIYDYMSVCMYIQWLIHVSDMSYSIECEVCCSELQCVAVCCSVLQCVAVRCDVITMDFRVSFSWSSTA